MLWKILPLLGLLTLGACAGYHHEVQACRGSFVAANPGQWAPTRADLRETR